MEIKAYLQGRADKCHHRLDEINARLGELSKLNDESKDEAELKGIRDELAELEKEKAETEAELKEIEEQLDALDKKADPEPKPEEKEGERKDPAPNPERRNFLTFDKKPQERKVKNMTIEERTKAAEELVKRGQMKIEKPELRAVTISGGAAVPTELNPNIENPAEVQYSTILDFVKVVDMTGAGYNRAALVDEWSTAAETTEGAQISESDPSFAFVTITPEKGFKTISYITNEVLRISPLDYYGKVEESANIALRVKVAAKIVTKAVGAEDDEGNPINDTHELEAIDENTLQNIAFQFGGDEGIFGPATLVLNKKDLMALGKLTNSFKQHVYKITPNAANPNIGVIEKDGLSCRYLLSKYLPAYSDASTAAEADAVCMLYGDMKSIEVDLFGAFDIKVSEDFKFDEDMLAVRGVAQIGVGVTRKHGLIEVVKKHE